MESKTDYIQALAYSIYRCNTFDFQNDTQIDYIEEIFNDIKIMYNIDCEALHELLIIKLQSNE